MKTTLTKPSETECVLDIEIPRERLDKIFDAKVKKYSREIKVNGFRTGNVPKNVVVARYKDPISAESLETLVDEAVREANKEHNLEPVAPGRIEKLENEDGKPILLQVIVEVDPPVDLKNYRFEIPVKAAPVPESDVETRVQDILRQLAEETPVDRPSQLNDVVVSQYHRIQIEGENQPLPQHPVFRVEIGKGSIPELDQGLTGVKVGEVKAVAFKFPNPYPSNPLLAGKSSSYDLAVDQVLEVKHKELDDAFAKSIGYENLVEMREQIRNRLVEGALQQAKEVAWDEAIRRLIDSNPLSVPKARIQNYVNRRLEEMGPSTGSGRASSAPESEEYKALEQEAEIQIRRWRLLDAVATKENVKPTQDDVDARIQRLAPRYGTTFENLKASFRKNGKIIELREEIKAEKTLDFIIGYAA